MTFPSLPQPGRKRPRACSVSDCTKTDGRFIRGLCGSHYKKWIRYGNPLEHSRREKGVGGTPDERFWSRVSKEGNPLGCWLWTGSLNKPNGYGRTNYGKRSRRCHHVAWFLSRGEWPAQHILHSCDNPHCVNPNHLREGTHQENMKERDERGRLARGNRSGAAVLKESDIPSIRQLLSEGVRVSEIARMYQISEQSISSIKFGKTWKHVSDDL